MIEVSPELFTAIFLLAILGGVLTGYHIALVIIGVGTVIGYFLIGPKIFFLMSGRVNYMIMNYNMLAIPLFTFMGLILSHSAIADKLYGALHLWLGRLRGGLALSTVVMGTVLAASLGVVQASVSMLTTVSLGAMVKRGYSKELATGSICAGGTLGILIPPSIMLVILGMSASLSIGKLFFGAFIPGLVLSGLYLTYITVRSWLQPQIAPIAPIEERQMPFTGKVALLLTWIVPPLIIMLSVLGTIFLGIATVYEAAGVGAAASVMITIAYRKFSWKMLKYAMCETLRVTGFVMLVTACANAAVGIFFYFGGRIVIADMVMAMPFGQWGAFVAIMVVTFILGMFIDWISIILIVVSILVPIAPMLGFDPIWFALMICVNLQMSFMTPPLAQSIFVCRGSAAPELGVTTADIIRGVIPFVILIMVGLGVFVAFPGLILWLPGKILG
ncbi:MAG: TRAP transporter large permease subunit [Dehalococcoidales bacterium]|nr:TRAP transporter large permease subunit [Dehalococcoidales bacterium]MDP7415393.1 TRAP transporter large permease subunit [Dehalococcoidales bacterium]